MCCGGCSSGGGELVENLCLFLHHGDVAKRAFVTRGGLEALHVLISKAVSSSSSRSASGPMGSQGPGGAFYEADYDDGEWGGGASGDEVIS